MSSLPFQQYRERDYMTSQTLAAIVLAGALTLGDYQVLAQARADTRPPRRHWEVELIGRPIAVTGGCGDEVAVYLDTSYDVKAGQKTTFRDKKILATTSSGFMRAEGDYGAALHAHALVEAEIRDGDDDTITVYGEYRSNMFIIDRIDVLDHSLSFGHRVNRRY
jgi:hypothetical protein